MPTATPAITRPPLTSAQFARLASLIHARSGVHLPETRKYVLEGRLAGRLAELDLDDFNQYLALLTIGPCRHEEFEEMLGRIAIHETAFFRNEPQLDAFEQVVLPELLSARAASRRLRVWSAACSTGEEAYTLAILIHRALGLALADWRVEVLGTDFSELALRAARAGRYTDYALRAAPALIKQRSFRREGPLWAVRPEIASLVSFETHNLLDRVGARRFGGFDAIFCRNALLYFDAPMKETVLRALGAQLAPDGALFIGATESLRGLDTPFDPAAPERSCYRLRDEEGTAP